jgi:hypothetical protein
MPNRVPLAEIAVCFVQPVLPGWSEDVNVDGIFKSFGGMGKVSRDYQDLAGADDFFAQVHFVFSKEKFQSSSDDGGNLLVGVRMPWHDTTFGEDEPRNHGFGAGNKLAREQGIERFRRNSRPTGMEEFRRHGRQGTAKVDRKG